jgi:type VI secretion system secreted protein Hcp
MKLLRACIAASLLSFPLAPAAQGAVLLVLKLDGIEGESQIAGHANEIELRSVSFAAEQSAASREAAKMGGAAYKAEFTPFILTKGSDKASPQLFLNSVLGKVIKNAKISFLLTTGGPAPIEFFSISLGNLMISRYSVAAANGDDTPQEEIMLNYQKVLLNYTPRVGAPIITGFDLVKNVPITVIQ